MNDSEEAITELVRQWKRDELDTCKITLLQVVLIKIRLESEHGGWAARAFMNDVKRTLQIK